MKLVRSRLEEALRAIALAESFPVKVSAKAIPRPPIWTIEEARRRWRSSTSLHNAIRDMAQLDTCENCGEWGRFGDGTHFQTDNSSTYDENRIPEGFVTCSLVGWDPAEGHFHFQIMEDGFWVRSVAEVSCPACLVSPGANCVVVKKDGTPTSGIHTARRDQLIRSNAKA